MMKARHDMESMSIYLASQSSRRCCNGNGQDRTGRTTLMSWATGLFPLLVYFPSHDVHSILSFLFLYIEYLLSVHIVLSPWSTFSFPSLMNDVYQNRGYEIDELWMSGVSIYIW